MIFKRSTAADDGPAAPGVPQHQPVEFTVGETPTGLLITRSHPDGNFDSFAVEVVKDEAAKGETDQCSGWMSGAPIKLDIRPLSEGRAQLQLSVGSPASGQITVYEDEAVNIAVLARLVRAVWMKANSSNAGVVEAQTAAPIGVSGGNILRPSPSYDPPGGETGQRADAPAGVGSRIGKRVAWAASAIVVAISLVGGGWMAANRWLRPTGPGLDLSSMSVDEVAMLDSNPRAVRQVQDSLLEALSAGRAQGAANASQIEKDHIEALRALGLNPGVSMKNAMNCLAK